MSLSREELEEMQKTLKEAFDIAKKRFNANKHYGADDTDVQAATKTLVKTSTAIMKIEESLRAMDDSHPLAKLSSPKMPGKL